MSDSNGGFTQVWVMDDKDKAVAGFVIVVLAVLLGGWWAWGYFFPSEQERLSQAASAKRDVESNLSSLDSSIKSLESLTDSVAKGDRGSDTLDNLASAIRRVADSIADSDKKLKLVERYARRFQHSDNLEARSQGASLVAFHESASARLQVFKERQDKAAATVAEQLPKK